MALALILLFSWMAHLVGAPLIMGGFAAGIALSQHFRFNLMGRLGLPALDRWLAPSPNMAHRLEEQMRPLIHTFAPMFFVMVGVSLNLNTVDWSSPHVWQLGGALIAVGFIGKIAAGFFISETRFHQMAIGLSMVPRGEVGLIFAQLGLNQKILDTETYAALLIVIAITTVAPPFLLKWWYRREQPAV
jgi:Kef-type K+ transport system membrane component KefB